MIINFKIFFRVIIRMSFIIAASMLVCAAIALAYDESIWPFVYGSSVSLLIGLLCVLAGSKDKDEHAFNRKDAYFTVTFAWIIMSVLGALPYVFSGSIPYFLDAFFESVSGFTTTGSSILTDIEILPHSVLFWRSLTHWIGGIGIIMLVVIVLPSLQMGVYQLFTLESSLQDKIHPKIKEIGKRLLFIYILLTVAEVVLLMFGQMSLFESVCHAFGTIATGGFSPRNTSIAGYSPYIQYVIMIFMVLAGTNFVVHYYFLKRKFKKNLHNEEFKFYLLILLVFGLIVTGILFFDMHKPFELAFREGFFQVISIITCTGFATADYLQWPTYAWVLIFLLMFVGGSTGSTAGGIKVVRHLIALKNIKRVFKKLNAPNAVHFLYLNGKKIGDDSNNTILTFISIYIFIFIIASALLMFLGIDGKTAGGAVATCMAGIGPGLGTVGPASNFFHLPDLAKLILCFVMLIGRLEIYTVIILFSKEFWKK